MGGKGHGSEKRWGRGRYEQNTLYETLKTVILKKDPRLKDESEGKVKSNDLFPCPQTNDKRQTHKMKAELTGFHHALTTLCIPV